jgi:tRNA dimethylallyltransferase
MKNLDDIIAIIGPTASGKSDLALKLAKKIDAIILSVDSLSVYKEIDIASAKPSKEELNEVKHFGIDLLYPNESFDVIKFIDEYKRAKSYAKKRGLALIIVGGSSFYLKVLTQGISKMPKISKGVEDRVNEVLKDLKSAYSNLEKVDLEFAKKIEKNDRYRIQKAYEILFSTNLTPTKYFNLNPPLAIEPNLKIYEIKVNREHLREKIKKRTKKMIEYGLIDEVAYLEYKYSRAPNSMKSIGIKEVLDYFDGYLDKRGLEEKIIINTARLAKRQITFNKTQFSNILDAKILEKIVTF